MKIAASYLIVAGILVSATIRAADFPGCPEGIHNSYECAQYREIKLEIQQPGLFARRNDKLEIKRGQRVVKTYVDGNNEAAGDTYYNAVQYFPSASLVIIHAQHDEGDTYYALSLRSGIETHIDGHPLLSPDRRRIAVFGFDIDSEFGPNILAVYSIDQGQLQLEFEIKPTGWGPSAVRWIDGARIAFTKAWYDDKLKILTQKRILRRRFDVESMWVIE